MTTKPPVRDGAPNGAGPVGVVGPVAGAGGSDAGEAAAYRHAVDRVMSLADFERGRRDPRHSGFHLERMSMLLRMFGDPHLATPTIHVAGTKGKGSVAAMMASVLSACGHRTGLYTSPHLHTVRERIRVNGEPVTEGEFTALVDLAWPAVAEVSDGGYGGVTTFEVMTLMAFLHFRVVDVAVQVIEVGLGGRLDSTNLVEPLVSVITPISLDHTAILGNTIAGIAAEKAGIIKPGVPVVVSPQPPDSGDAIRVIREIAERSDAEVIEVDALVSWRSITSDRSGQRFELRTALGAQGLTTPLLGPHQVENAATAVVALQRLPAALRPSASQVADGLASVGWPCRVEYLSLNGPSGIPTNGDPIVGGPIVVADGAHNTDSIDRLLESVPELRPGSLVLVFGALSGHSAANMLERLASLSPRVVAVRSRHPRAAALDELVALAVGLGVSVVGSYETVAEGMRCAAALAEPGEVVLATGSISVAAEAREWALGLEPECYPNILLPDAVQTQP